MKSFGSLVEAAAFFTETVVAVDHAERHAIERGAKTIQKEAKRVIGTYDYGWPELAASTQSDRESKGYPADEPLLRDGTLRDSIQYTVISAKEAEIGSNDKIAVYQELGTSTIPARSFLAGAAAHEAETVAKEVGEVMVLAMIGEKVTADLSVGALPRLKP